MWRKFLSCIKILAILSVSTVKNESTFSILRRLKINLWNSTSNIRLNGMGKWTQWISTEKYQLDNVQKESELKQQLLAQMVIKITQKHLEINHSGYNKLVNIFHLRTIIYDLIYSWIF